MTNWKDAIVRGAMLALVAAMVVAPSQALSDEGAEVPAVAPEVEAEVHAQPVVPVVPVVAPAPAATIGEDNVFDSFTMMDKDIRLVVKALNGPGKRNIIFTKEVTGNVSVNLYDVTFLDALDAILGANGFAHSERGNFIYIMTKEQQEEQIRAQRKMGDMIIKLSYISAEDARSLLGPLLSSDGRIEITPPSEVGLPSTAEEAGGNSLAISDILVVQDYEDNLRRIAEAVVELDARPDQVLIAATLLRATLSESNALGVDFDLLGGVDFNSLDGLTDILSMDTSKVPADFSDGNIRGQTDFAGLVPDGGVSVGFVSNNVAFFIRALEDVTDVNVMANPKLLVLNKQRGEVFVGSEDGYLTTTFTETTASETVTFLKTGTRLLVRPFIGKDGYVRMEIHPEDSTGGIERVGTSALPFKRTTEVTSNVLVRDGHTIVIGGLFREEVSTGRSQTPLLGNVPYVGALFRATADSTSREEVIVLITPRIVSQDLDESVSEQLRDQIERFRVGQRKGLRWWGRGRLAQAQVRCGRKALAEGDREKALWHIDNALSMQPKLEEAIRLKERLTSRAYWADEVRQSAAKNIIKKMIMNELDKPIGSVIPPDKPRDGRVLPDDVKKALGVGPLLEQPLKEGYKVPE